MIEAQTIGFELALPRAPSINELWKFGQGNVYKSDAYKAWFKQADLAYMLAFARGKRPAKVEVPFRASVLIQEGRADLDNVSFKAILDWLQSRELISNDKLARRLLSEWGDAPTGCIVKIEAAA